MLILKTEPKKYNMPKPNQTLPEDYFNDVYRANEDPWSFETSEYERSKYKATMDALPRDM